MDMNPTSNLHLLKDTRELITSQGYLMTTIELPSVVRNKVIERDWSGLDQAIAQETQESGVIFRELRKYTEFSSIEFIISIRSSIEYPDEDGIWHNDGSRVLAFSLSLTLNPSAIEGGRLEIRKYGSGPQETQTLSTPPFGTMIVFATGIYGFEHKINRVSQGERLIIAGWCT